jgi:hypothetical protein
MKLVRGIIYKYLFISCEVSLKYANAHYILYIPSRGEYKDYENGRLRIFLPSRFSPEKMIPNSYPSISFVPTFDDLRKIYT